jgi:U2-associated protein SR140
LEKKMNWGRLRAEKWKRSVGNVLSLWEGWCVFPQESQDHFVEVFNSPPLTKEEEQQKKEALVEGKAKSKWKAVATEKMDTPPRSHEEAEIVAEDDVDGLQMEDDNDVDGEPMDEDEDVDGEPMDEEDVDGEPMDEDEYAPAPPSPHDVGDNPKTKSLDQPAPRPGPTRPLRQRLRAVDMFADSGSEED